MADLLVLGGTEPPGAEAGSPGSARSVAVAGDNGCGVRGEARGLLPATTLRQRELPPSLAVELSKDGPCEGVIDAAESMEERLEPVLCVSNDIRSASKVEAWDSLCADADSLWPSDWLLAPMVDAVERFIASEPPVLRESPVCPSSTLVPTLDPAELMEFIERWSSGRS